jgi:hypothetical protein
VPLSGPLRALTSNPPNLWPPASNNECMHKLRVLGGPCVPFPDPLRAPTWVPKIPPNFRLRHPTTGFMESYHIVYKFIWHQS